MRSAIRQRLLNRLTEVGTRVYEPHMGGPNVQKPFVIVKMGGETKSSSMKYGYDLPVEVWVYTDITSHGVGDALVSEVVNALGGIELTSSLGQKFTLRYAGSSGDFEDEDWEALTRRIDFTTARVREG